jgi:N-methylhydantoinase A/oxoprolinase/acetone carboxylase beta subunit
MKGPTGEAGKFGLGIDTGGTYTDAAVVDLKNKTVLAKAKAPTTYQNLAIGLRSAVDGVIDHDGFDPNEIRLVGVSTTLATNSILEGKGGRAGLIGIGWEPKEGWYLGEQKAVFIKGGHEVSGFEKEPMDMEEAEAAIEEICKEVDAIAVSGLFSVHNHNHESKIRRLIRERTGLPVVCGHELTGELGIMERTVTAVLNARLIPILDTFLDDVENSLRRRDIHAPIMVFKGDGSLMNIETARERPVETVLSGPAASSMGGRILAGIDDCIVVDVGGTSTDIAFLEGGFPRIVPDGATIGEWRTRVRAVDMWTAAMGGDSEIIVDRRGNMSIGPERVIPLSMASETYEGFLDKLATCGQARFLVAYSRDGSGLSEKERSLFDFLRENGPSTFGEIRANVDVVLLDRFVKRLRDKNMVVGIGLTPTDVLHLKGDYLSGNVRASELGVDLARPSTGLSREEFVEKVLNKVAAKISQEVIKKIILDEGGVMPQGSSCDYLLETASWGRESELMRLEAKVNRKIVGIGAPAHVYIPEIGRRLGCEVIVPQNHEVGNAVGAVCSPIVETAQAVIFPQDGKYHLFSSFYIPVTYEHMGQAIEAARNMVKRHVRERAEKAGAQEINVKIEVNIKKSIGGENVEGEIISKIDVMGRAVGQPPI